MALQVRELSDDEVTRMFPQRGQMDLSEYESIFDGAYPGKGFEVSNDGMSTRALKRRLGLAVKAALGPGHTLKYKPGPKGDASVAFVVKAPHVSDNGHAENGVSPRRRSRRRALAAV